MKSYYKKLAVSALAATMILPIAACNKKEEEVPEIKSGMEITAGTPWYEAKHITVDSGIDRTRADRCNKAFRLRRLLDSGYILQERHPGICVECLGKGFG